MRPARSVSPASPSASGWYEVSSRASRSMRSGARRSISKATRPPIEWPATASGPAGAVASTCSAMRAQRVEHAVVGHVAGPERVDLRLPDLAVAQQAGQQHAGGGHQNSSVSTPACAAAS